MAKRVAINGFGRIGRLFFREAFEDPDIEIVAINDISDIKAGAYLLTYDSTFRKYNHKVSTKEEGSKKFLVVDDVEIPFYAERDPENLPWKELDVDVAYESTGVFRKNKAFLKHIKSGAKKVFVSAPADDVDATIVYGVNSDILTKDMVAVSGASCTTNCLAPICKVLDDNFGIEHGIMTTIHSYTNDQRVLDIVHKDFRRARAAAVNIIPTTTGAAKAIGKVLPKLNGKLDGFAIRVPTQDGSVVDLKVTVKKNTSVEEINAAMKKASEGELKDVLGYTEEPLVSTDIIGISYGSLFDAGVTRVIDGNFVSVLSWYDNEHGFTMQSIRTVKRMLELM
ncbi:MAG: type I glyceraldehyde-3-phosphate dehydrogenase [Promethearchaeota archaeon]